MLLASPITGNRLDFFRELVGEQYDTILHCLENVMVDQSSLSEAPSQPDRGGGIVLRVLAILGIGVVLGLVIYFSPRLFSAPDKLAANYPRLRTGGTSVIFVVTENVWKGKYFKDKGVHLVCDSAGTTAGVTRMLEKTYSIAFTHAPVCRTPGEGSQRGLRRRPHSALSLRRCAGLPY